MKQGRSGGDRGSGGEEGMKSYCLVGRELGMIKML